MSGRWAHSHCVECDEDSVWTVGPATTWQSPGRPTQDVCQDHVTEAVARLISDRCAVVQVSQVKQYFYGVTGHTSE